MASILSKTFLKDMIAEASGAFKDAELTSKLATMIPVVSLPISESIINATLATFVTDIPELTSLTIEISEGSFEVLAIGKKIVTFKSKTRFEIMSCEISTEMQVINFRCTSPTDLSADKLIDRMLIAVFKAIACQIFKIEPAKFVLEGVPGITIKGDIYTVDLSQTYVAGKVTPKIEGLLKLAGGLGKVKELKCVPQAINVVFGR